MKRKIGMLTAAAAICAALATAAPASAQRGGPPQGGPPQGRPSAQSFDIAYLDRLRVDHAQAHLRVNGFTKARSLSLAGRQWDLWYNRDFREACAGFTSLNGTVTGVRFFADSECGVGSTPTPGRELRPEELEGLRVDEAQRRLRLSDYTPARSIDINGRQWDLWQNPRGRTNCVGFSSFNGRVTQTDRFNDRECSGQSGSRPVWGGPGGPGGPGWGGGRFDPRDLMRLRVRDGQDALRRAGYAPARSMNISGRQWDLWENPRARDACVGFTSYNGQITDTDTFRESNCRR